MIKNTKPKQDNLLDQFITTLQITYDQVLKNKGIPEEDYDTKKRIEKALEAADSWRGAYRAEQMMIPLLKGDALTAALKKQLLNADKFGNKTLVEYEPIPLISVPT